jgi:proteasome assembly chaperone (PAC2) family protein
VEGNEEAYQEELVNDFYYAEVGEKGLLIFIGTEPNLHEDEYVNSLLDVAEESGVKRIITPAGVGDEVPFGKERPVSCTYSLERMKEELKEYAVTLSNYSRNATIGMVINHYCKQQGIESVRMSARTPSYQITLMMNSDKRAMYDLLRRIRYMFNIELDLSDLEKESAQQLSEFENALKRLYIDDPDLEPKITSYLQEIEDRFVETRFEEPTRIPDVFLNEFQ